VIEIPASNWHVALATAIETARDGETIKCLNKSQAELGESARQRMCPGKRLFFVSDEKDVLLTRRSTFDESDLLVIKQWRP
jgi:hypothetical protein